MTVTPSGRAVELLLQSQIPAAPNKGQATLTEFPSCAKNFNYKTAQKVLAVPGNHPGPPLEGRMA